MLRYRRPGLPLLVLLPAACLALSACGGSSSKSTTTTSATNAASTTSGGSPATSAARTAAISCLSQHGVSVPTGTGAFAALAKIPAATITAATTACQSEITAARPAGRTGTRPTVTAAQRKAEQTALAAVTTCLAAHGYKLPTTPGAGATGGAGFRGGATGGAGFAGGRGAAGGLAFLFFSGAGRGGAGGAGAGATGGAGFAGGGRGFGGGGAASGLAAAANSPAGVAAVHACATQIAKLRTTSVGFGGGAGGAAPGASA
jgi:hypothetical protein